MLAVNNHEIQNLMPTAEEWIKIKEILILMKLLEKTTKLLSTSSYPTIVDVRLVFDSIQEYLNNYVESDKSSQYILAASINKKIGEYKDIIDNTTIVVTILNLQTKLSLFEVGQQTSNAINKVREIFGQYFISNKSTQPPSHIIDDVDTARQYFHVLKRYHTVQISETKQKPTDELERYLALSCTEVIKPSLCVACEQAFLIAENTISKTRNFLDPETSRASLCSKSWIENKILPM
ncbi:2183_t:CDS:2, partial [Dentiscutata heterogama]